MRMLRRLLALALFAGLFWTAWMFTHGNTLELEIDLIVWRTPPVAVWVALLVAFGAGAGLSALALALPLARGSLVKRRYRKEADGLASEVHQLRNLPLAGSGVEPVADSAAPEGRGG